MTAAIRQMLSDGQGQLSMARCTLAAIVAWVLVKAIMFNVAALIHGVAPVAMDVTDVGMVTMAIAGKVAQVFGEPK